MAKLVLSLLISTAVLYIAKGIGWINLGNELPVLTTNAVWNEFLWLAIIALVFTAVSYIAGHLFAIFVLGTCGLGCFVYPVYVIALGYLKLMGVAYFLPSFTHTTIWWQVLLLSMLVGISLPSSGSSSTTQTTTS